jgi:hypothetical protein
MPEAIDPEEIRAFAMRLMLSSLQERKVKQLELFN